MTAQTLARANRRHQHRPDPRPGSVVGGVDTHADTHYGAVLDSVGRLLDTRQFPADAGGYRQLLDWMRSFGDVDRVGVEGTSSYGAGLTRYLRAAGVHVIEVNRPDRHARTASIRRLSTGERETSAGSRSTSHRHHRSLPCSSSLAPRKGRTYLAATGSAMTVWYSPGSTMRFPPSRGVDPNETVESCGLSVP